MKSKDTRAVNRLGTLMVMRLMASLAFIVAVFLILVC